MKITTTHTKSPWKSKEAPQGYRITPLENDFFTVAVVSGFDMAEAKANADLICAAPDLLEACRQALPFLRNHVVMTIHEGPSDRIALDKMESAIEKAGAK